MRARRRYHRLRQATHPVPACHEQQITVVGPPDAIGKLNELIEKTPDPLKKAGIPSLRPKAPAPPPSVYTPGNGKWHAQAIQSEAAIDLSLQVYGFDVRRHIVPSDVTENLRRFLSESETELLRRVTICVDPVVDSPFESGDAPFESGDAPFESGDAPFESGDAPFESGDAPLAVDPNITGNTVKGQPAMERIGFNWLRQARSELIGSDVTVLILDTLPVQGGIDVAQDYVDFWLDWVGDQPAPPESSEEEPTPPVIPAADIHKYHGVLVASLVRHLSPASTIVAARVLDDHGKGWSTTLIQAILWALSHRKNKTMINGRRLIHDKLILNMSMGLPRTQAEEAEAVCLLHTLHAASKAATLSISAAGNDSWRKPENPVEPAAYGFFADTRATAFQVIAAAGTDRPAKYAFFSNEGHIAAPCRHIIGDTGTNSQIQQKYGFSSVHWSGTSFATPQITGLAALLWSSGRVPYYQIKQHIWRTCRLPRSWNGVREIDFMRAFRAI